jgi:hypothetical protein
MHAMVGVRVELSGMLEWMKQAVTKPAITKEKEGIVWPLLLMSTLWYISHKLFYLVAFTSYNDLVLRFSSSSSFIYSSC